MNLEFYRGKNVLITGHTGFKGSWLSKILVGAGANVIGYSLKPNTWPNLFTQAKIENDITHIIGDICDYKHMLRVFKKYQPEIVFHLAAQPLVLEGYKKPLLTYDTNVMGVVNLLECIRNTSSVKTIVNITTDKVYQNMETGESFVETDRLNGYDPYSNSKSCSELVTECYYNSFLKERGINVITMRAGNVIGGGDYAKNRIIPDCVRAAKSKKPIICRNPNSVRPYQHVLEPLFAYLQVGMMKFNNIEHFNIGPQKKDHVKTGELVKKFANKWGEVQYEIKENKDAPHEATLLMLDCNKIERELGIKPVWDIDMAIEKVCDFHKAKDIPKEMDKEINEYIVAFNNMRKEK